MLVQGSNLPILITFEEDDPSTFQDLSVIVYPRGSTSSSAILSWGINDVEIDGNEVLCPIDQEDLMPPNYTITEDTNISIEIKWLGEDDNVYNVAIVHDYIAYRKDTTVLGDSEESEGGDS